MPDREEPPLVSFPRPPVPPFKGKWRLFWIAAGVLVVAAVVLMFVNH